MGRDQGLELCEGTCNIPALLLCRMNYPRIILRPRDERSRDMSQGPESGSSGKAKYPKMAVVEGYKHWFPVCRVCFFPLIFTIQESAIDSCSRSSKLEIYSLFLRILPHSSTITSLITEHKSCISHIQIITRKAHNPIPSLPYQNCGSIDLTCI